MTEKGNICHMSIMRNQIIFYAEKNIRSHRARSDCFLERNGEASTSLGHTPYFSGQACTLDITSPFSSHVTEADNLPQISRIVPESVLHSTERQIYLLFQ